MQWRAEGYVIGVHSLGENDAVLHALTREYGLHSGYVKGGSGRRLKPALQAGNQLALSWQSRLADGLGRYTVELAHSHVGSVLGDPSALLATQAVAAILSASLTEREAHPAIYDALEIVLKLIATGDHLDMAEALAKLELGILSDLGYGLDLSNCAATGQVDDLAYISPKTGRAVSREAGAPYKDRLFILPHCFQSEVNGGSEQVERMLDIRQALRVTGYFLEKHLWHVSARQAPQARSRFLALLDKESVGLKNKG